MTQRSLLAFSSTAALLALSCGDSGEGTDSAATTAPSTASSSNTTPTSESSPTATDVSTTDSMGSDSTASSSAGSDTATQDGAPVIINFGTNVTQLTEGESVLFSAVVTDPDGVDDVIGGQLTSPDGNIIYGTFIATAMEGAYEVTVSWAEIHQAETIEFEGAESVRTFRAEFYDQTAKKANATVDLSLHCGGIAACGGSCTDLASDHEHCGTCARQCDYLDGGNGEWGTCTNGQCDDSLGPCLMESDGFADCTDYCASIGESCSAGCDFGEPGDNDNFSEIWFSDFGDCSTLGGQGPSWDDNCAVPFDFFFNHDAVRCCCTDNV